MTYALLRGDRNPADHERAQKLVSEAFAPFMDHSRVVNDYWSFLYERWADWQFLLADTAGNAVVLGNCFPMHLDVDADELPDGGVEWALEEAVKQSEDGIRPNTAVAFQIVISDGARGQGLSYRSIDAMKELCRTHSVEALFAPVRPNRKEQYPTMPIDEYVAWRRDDDLPVDDWMRVHIKTGGEMLNICHRSFVVEGTLDDWERWTGRRFAGSGPQPVEGALAPVIVEGDVATYVEPNVWFRHRL